MRNLKTIIMKKHNFTPFTGLKNDKRESSENYRGEIMRVGDWRISVCRDQIQFLVQARTRANSPKGPRWESKSFCLSPIKALELWPAPYEAKVMLATIMPDHAKYWEIGQ